MSPADLTGLEHMVWCGPSEDATNGIASMLPAADTASTTEGATPGKRAAKQAALPIVIASDHAGVDLKAELAKALAIQGYSVLDLGTDGTASVDYPDFAKAVADAMADGRAARGVLICGSGIGISIAANRHPHVRAALVSEPLSARLCREHNDANVIVFGARLIGIDQAKECLTVFLTTPFSGGDRHQRRIDKLSTPR